MTRKDIRKNAQTIIRNGLTNTDVAVGRVRYALTYYDRPSASAMGAQRLGDDAETKIRTNAPNDVHRHGLIRAIAHTRNVDTILTLYRMI